MDGGAWQVTVHGIAKSRIRNRLSDFTFTFTGADGSPGDSDGKESACNAGDPGSVLGSGGSLGDPLEKGMATNFNILAWRILWTEEPDSYSP